MAAGIYNMTLQAGARCQLRMTMTTKSTGLPINLTNYEAKLQVRADYGAEAVLLEFSSTASPATIVLGGAAGTIDLDKLIPTTLKNGYIGKYDLLLNPAGGAWTDAVRLLQGSVTISPQVTV